MEGVISLESRCDVIFDLDHSRLEHSMPDT